MQLVQLTFFPYLYYRKICSYYCYLANTKELSCLCQVQVVHLEPVLVHNRSDSSVIHLHGASCQTIGLFRLSILKEELFAVFGWCLHKYGKTKLASLVLTRLSMTWHSSKYDRTAAWHVTERPSTAWHGTALFMPN